MSESSSPKTSPRQRTRQPGHRVSKSGTATTSHTRLERKRATDRESQRAVRERTRKYISSLEDLVKTLRNDQPDERLQDMIRQCKRLDEENEQLKNTITGIGRMIRDIGVPPPNIASNVPIPITMPHCSMSVVNREREAGDAVTNGRIQMTCPRLRNEAFLEQHPQSFAEQQPELARSPVAVDEGFSLTQNYLLPENDMFCNHPEGEARRSEIFPATPAIDASQEISLDGNSDIQLFSLVNNVLSKAQAFAAPSIEPKIDADIAIRAVVYGWHAAEQLHPLDQSWQLLRQIDQSIFFCCGPVERLAILRVLRLKLQHAADSSQYLPTFLSPRPIQKFVKHSSLIDYFVWPELRELLILKSGTLTQISNRQAAIFASSIRFSWSFDLSDIWTRSIHTGLYSFSSLFDERWKDIRSWMMSSPFFDLCPELIGYIQIYDPAPGYTLSVPGCSGVDARSRNKEENNNKDSGGGAGA